MLYFKAISCPFEHEVKQFVFINSRNAWEVHTCELLRYVMLLDIEASFDRAASHLLYVSTYNRLSELSVSDTFQY